jgi:hypothetical protein
MSKILSPFGYAPDVLLMELPKGSMRLKIQAFESPWGVTDEQLCYWDGVLIGQVVHNAEVRFAKLLPKLDRCRSYPWPSAERFEAAVIDIFNHFPDLEIRCERDCDQYPVEYIDKLDELFNLLPILWAYSVEGRVECPNFSYRPLRVSGIYC